MHAGQSRNSQWVNRTRALNQSWLDTNCLKARTCKPKTYTDPKQDLMKNGHSRSFRVIYFRVSKKATRDYILQCTVYHLAQKEPLDVMRIMACHHLVRLKCVYYFSSTKHHYCYQKFMMTLGGAAKLVPGAPKHLSPGIIAPKLDCCMHSHLRCGQSTTSSFHQSSSSGCAATQSQHV